MIWLGGLLCFGLFVVLAFVCLKFVFCVSSAGFGVGIRHNFGGFVCLRFICALVVISFILWCLGFGYCTITCSLSVVFGFEVLDCFVLLLVVLFGFVCWLFCFGCLFGWIWFGNGLGGLFEWCCCFMFSCLE